MGVLGGGGDAEVGEAAALQFEPAGRLEAGALLVQPLRGELGRERLDVQRDARVAGSAAQQAGEPAVADLTRVAADRERSLPALADAEAVGAQLERGRTEQAACGVSVACLCASADRRCAWITPVRSEPSSRAGRVEAAREQRGRLLAVERVERDLGAAQQLGRLGGVPGERDAGEFGLAFARAQHEHDSSPLQRLRLCASERRKRA